VWPSNQINIDCSWFGVWFTYSDGTREFCHRRFVRGRRPDWMLERLPWWVQ
jgi:hypothetical protein